MVNSPLITILNGKATFVQCFAKLGTCFTMLTWNENENHIWYFDNDADDAFFDTVECLYVLRCSRNWLLWKIKVSNCLSWRFEGVPGSFTLSPRVGLNLPLWKSFIKVFARFPPVCGLKTHLLIDSPTRGAWLSHSCRRHLQPPCL